MPWDSYPEAIDKLGFLPLKIFNDLLLLSCGQMPVIIFGPGMGIPWTSKTHHHRYVVSKNTLLA